MKVVTRVADLCEACREALVPGALFPIASDGHTDHAYVERCDECELFVDDLAAAVSVAAYLREEVELSADKRPYVSGYTFEEALDRADTS